MTNRSAAGRTSLGQSASFSAREDRKARTRRRLLSVACDLFIAKGFENTSIDDIANSAQVGRATVYLHFVSKLAIVEALRAEVTDHLDTQYERLKSMQRANIKEINRWIHDFLEACRQDRRIVFVLIRTIPAESHYTRSYMYYDSVIRRLGRGLPSFAAACSGNGTEARAQALLLLLQLEAIVRHWIMDRSEPDRNALCMVLAKALHAFINTPATTSTTGDRSRS